MYSRTTRHDEVHERLRANGIRGLEAVCRLEAGDIRTQFHRNHKRFTSEVIEFL